MPKNKKAKSNFTKIERGLVIVTGATGAGKSTTLASLVNEINLAQTRHVITIEDPIEFLFTERRSIITQREIDRLLEILPQVLSKRR